MPPSISIVIIDSDPDSLKSIVKCIESLGNHATIEGTAATFERGYELIHKKRPMVVIMDIQQDTDLSIERIKTIIGRFPQISVFAMSSDKSSDTILKVMRAGATEYILKPVSDTDMINALQKLGRLWISKHAPEEEFGHVYTLFSPKNGVGTTTLAVNLAESIYEHTKEPTVLVDLDLTGGDVTTFLNIKPSYTISDVTLNISRLDRSFLEGIIVKHKTGFSVLAEPQRIAEGVSITGNDIKKVIGLLKTMYKHIVIDTEPVLAQTTKAAFEMSDTIFLIFVMSLPAIKNIRKYLEYFKGVGVSQDKIKLIVNRYVKKGEIKLEDAEKVLNYPIFYNLPNEYELTMACINKGVTIQELDPRSKLNLAIKELSEKIVKIKK